MKTSLTLLLGCWLSLSSFAQPGPFGGNLRFRLFDAQGRQIDSGRADYQLFPSWKPDSLADNLTRRLPTYYTPNKSFTYGREGYWQYASTPTPGGGIVRDDFTINVVHGRDTMRIRGLDNFGHFDLRVDSIPFLPGRFQVPQEYVHLLNVRAGHGRISNLDWALFREAAARPDRITAERLVLRRGKNGAPPDTLLPACARLKVRYTESDHTSDVYLTTSSGRRPRLLLRHLPGQPVAACAGPALLLLTDKLVLKSEDEGATWRVYQVQDEDVAVRWHQDVVRLKPFHVRNLWAEGDRVLISGARSYSYGPDLPGIYELHFTPDTTAPAVQRSYALARADVRAALLGEERQRAAQFRYNMHQTLRRADNQAIVQQHLLRQCRLMQNSSYIKPAANWQPALNDGRPENMRYYPERPILTLQNGRFQYTGSHWVLTPDLESMEKNVPVSDLAGTYTFTDSTITFSPQPKPSAQPAALRNRPAFYPSGTYYYYFNPFNIVLITLTRPSEDFKSSQGITLRVRQ